MATSNLQKAHARLLAQGIALCEARRTSLAAANLRPTFLAWYDEDLALMRDASDLRAALRVARKWIAEGASE